jgi:hypothetical protein
MDLQMWFNVLVGVSGFLGGWILNNISRSIERLDEDVRQMPINYVTKADYKHDIMEVKEMLGKIFDRLETKADK